MGSDGSIMEEKEKRYCLCGCGQEINPGRYGNHYYVTGHNSFRKGKMKELFKDRNGFGPVEGAKIKDYFPDLALYEKLVVITPPQFCECGCGRMTNPGRKYINSHGRRKYPHPTPPRPCECGCGQMTKENRRFISGHNGRGRLIDWKAIMKKKKYKRQVELEQELLGEFPQEQPVPVLMESVEPSIWEQIVNT